MRRPEAGAVRAGEPVSTARRREEIRSHALSARHALGPRLLRFATATPARQARLFRFLSELGINYRRSPIVGEDFGDGEWRAGPLAGDRTPDGALGTIGRTATTLHAQLRGTTFHLVFFAGGQHSAAVLAATGEHDSRHLKLHVVSTAEAADGVTLTDLGGGLHRRYGVSHAATYLIRPDGHIAFRAPRLESTAVAMEFLGSEQHPSRS